MSTRLASRLIGEGVVSEAAVQAASARQLVYGGSLDTVLLEMGALGEEALWARLAAVTGLPAARPSLCQTADSDAAAALPLEQSTRLGAVPVARRGDTVDVLCAEPVAAAEIRREVASRGLHAELHVVPEVRLLTSRQRIYGEPIPGRYVNLIARLHGAAEIRPRRSPPPPAPEPREAAPAAPDVAALPPAAAQSPLERVLDVVGPLTIDIDLSLEEEPETGAQPTATMPDDPPGAPPELAVSSSAVPEPVADTPPGRRTGTGMAEAGASDAATEALCRRARDLQDKGRALALRALRRRHGHVAVHALMQELRRELAEGSPEAAERAAESLAELRDTQAIPALVERLVPASSPVALAAQRALVALAAQDFGQSQRRWSGWWHRRSGQHRMLWLIEGMGHNEIEIRSAAADELRQLAGVSFEFNAEASKPEREKAQQWARAWWEESGRARFEGGGSL